MLWVGCYVCEIVAIALNEPEDLLEQQFSKLFALKLVSNFECANFQNFRSWVARSGLGVVFIFSDYKTCNFILYFKDPAIPVHTAKRSVFSADDLSGMNPSVNSAVKTIGPVCSPAARRPR